MNEIDFIRGLEGEPQNNQDMVMGAEHFIRLKKQVGMSGPTHEDLELEKEARVFGSQVPDDIHHAAIPYSSRRQHYETHLKDKAQEEPSGYAKGMFGGAVIGAIPGALAGGLAGGPKGALIGGGAGALIGAGGGAIASHSDKSNINHAKSILGNKNKITESLNDEIASRASLNEYDQEGKHQQLLYEIRSGKNKNASKDALHGHLSTKLAEMRRKTANAVIDKVRNINPTMAATTGLGAMAGGLGLYLASRPQKDTGKSKAEEELEGMVEAQKSKPTRGLLSKMHKSNTELQHGYSKAFRDHPGKAAILGALSGGVIGNGIGRMAGALHGVK